MNMTRILTLLAAMMIIANVLWGQSPSFRSYLNPVIPGDHPDCTLSRIGDDFYTTGSSFNVTPVIYHSTDLVHWEAIAQPVSAAWSGYGDAPGGGCWGGQMVLYNGSYWHFFSRANTMHFVKAPDPRGPWSMPVKVNNPPRLPYTLGYDNSIFIDDDNKWYLVVKNGQPNNGIVELNAEGQPGGALYNLSWLNPAPSYPYSWAEGPVMWKYGGYYYYSFARDLGGGQKVMRSRTLTSAQDSWEMLGDFFNEADPQKNSSLFTSPNHASQAILLDDSTSWVVHPLYAKGEWKGQGRQGLLNQVRYSTTARPVADYPVNQSFTAPALSSSGIPWMVPKSDFFTAPDLHPEWSFLGNTEKTKFSLSERPGWLRLSPKSTAKANTVNKNDGEHNYALITRLDFTAKTAADQAGLWIMRGDEQMALKLVSTLGAGAGKTISFNFVTTKYEAENSMGDTLWLKLERINHKISGFYSPDGNEWTQVGQPVDISQIDSYSDFSTFTGTRQGLYVSGSSSAWFDLYIYRDAYTPILAECPANQIGTSRTYINGGYVLDNIHGNDWALYAGVEFGNAEYQKVPDSLKIVAACGSSGGTVEVWLDSLDSGEKIADCAINSTGGWRTFQTLAFAVKPVTGRHDVYLKFTGVETGKLFQIHSFYFTSRNVPSSAQPGSSGTVQPGRYGLEQNYPNPFNPSTNIQFEIPRRAFVSLRVYDLLGRVVAELAGREYGEGTHTVKFAAADLANGLYHYSLRSDDFTRTRKMMLLR